ncbi:MAG: ribosomal RNA small subunit methyltransferase A [Armatimonadetes bacterium]|nr:ribosomal RNA small subunit methyltransferase A [Armatimonadota bacterium]
MGQHFLVSDKVVVSIVGQTQGCSSALEVGPGPGVLTLPLCEALSEVRAVEIDTGILPVLAERAPTAQVVSADALRTDLSAILRLMPEPRALVSNMPYNITGPLLTAFAACRDDWAVGVLMMQKEVGDRVLAQAGDPARGSLSVFLQAQFDISVVCKVPPGAFLPPPKVDSIVLKFVPALKVDLERSPSFFQIVRQGFAQPRKTLANNLSGVVPKEAWDGLIDPRVRPHQLTLAQWEAVARHVAR